MVDGLATLNPKSKAKSKPKQVRAQDVGPLKVHIDSRVLGDNLKGNFNVSLGSVISKFSLDSLGSSMSKCTPSVSSCTGADETAVSNIDSHQPLGSTSGSDDKELSTSEGGRSNSGAESIDGPQQEITTFMICSIPFRVTSEQLLEAINSLGFQNTYDFVYMPSRSAKKYGKQRQGNVGYAFVNFKMAQTAVRFKTAFTGYSFSGVNAEKQILVRPAVCQGFKANMDEHQRKHQSDIMIFKNDDQAFQ
jgi:hypothetical protein